MEYSHRTGATSEDMSKQPESPDKDKSLSNEVTSGKKAATGNKKSKDSKKQQVVGIRKRVVPSESPDGGIVVKETVLVRVNSSSSETVDNETGEKSDSSDSETTPNDDSIVNSLRNKKLRKSDHAGKPSTKPLETTDPSGEPSTSDPRIKRRSGRGSVLPDEGAEIMQSSNSVIDEDDIPLHKFTRSRNSSPLKVPVVRVDRSGRSADKRESISAAEVNLRSTRQLSARTNSPKKTASDVLDDDADYDTDEFEELLDKMEPEEIKKLDFLSQVLEGDDSGSSDDDLPLVTKQKVVENFSSDDDLPLKPKSNASKSVPVETSKAESSDEEESQNNVKRTGRKKSSGPPIKKLQEIAISIAESLSDLQSSMSKTKGKAKKSKSNEEDLSPAVAASSVSPIKVIVKVPRNKTVTDLSEDDVSPTRRRSLRSRELPDLEQDLASESPSISAKKRSKGDVSQTPEVQTKDQPITHPNEAPDEEAKTSSKQSKKRTKPISDHSIQNSSLEVNDTQSTTESEAPQNNMKEVQKNADMSKSRKKAKPPTFIPVPIPEPNLETVVELDPNLIGELTPRLSRKRFKELSSTSTPPDSSKPSQDTESTSSASKISKKKVKTKSSEVPEESAQENIVHDVSSKSFKAKHRTAKSPVTPTETAPVSTSKSKKKSKGKADVDKPEIDEEKTASASTSIKSLPNKIMSKKGTHSTTNPEQVEGRILTRRKFPWEESLEELANVAPGGSKGKRLKLDENLADSADNDSVVTGSDVSEVSKSSRRSRSRGLENTADFSETESTLVKAETEAQSRPSKRNKKGKSSSRSSKRKVKATADNEPVSEDGEETKPADVSLEETQPSSKRLKKDDGGNQIDKEESNTTTLNSDSESNQNAFESDAAQFPSETAAVPASSLCQNPPVAASPTPAEAPESPKKSSKKGKIPAQENFCQVCLRYYSTQYNLFKHYASSYHKSSVEAKAKENASKGSDISDLLNAAPEKPESTESNERVEEAPTAADADASVQISEQTLDMESSQKKIINKISEVDNVSQEYDKSTETEHVAQVESSLENSIPQPSAEIPSHEDKNKSVPSSMESNQSASSETSSSEKEVEGNANTHCQVSSDLGLSNVPQDLQTCSEPQQYNQSHFEQHPYDGSHYQQPFNQNHYQPQHQYGQSQQYDQPQSSLQFSQQDGQQPHTANQPFGPEQSQGQQNQSSYNQSQVESASQPLDPIPSQPQDTTRNYEQQPQQLESNQHFNHQELSQSQAASHQSNELYDLQPRQQSEEQHQSYNNYNSADSWQSSDCGWGGPWRAPDITPSYAVDDGSIGLGSILDSVNQVLSGDGGISMSDVPMYADYASLSDLQHAIGANDEEMAVLRQLGEGSLRELIGPPPSAHPDEAEFLDLDNQKKAAERQASGPSTSSESGTETRRVNPFISTGRHGGSSKGSGKGTWSFFIYNF